jgi:hypothetical protein
LFVIKFKNSFKWQTQWQKAPLNSDKQMANRPKWVVKVDNPKVSQKQVSNARLSNCAGDKNKEETDEANFSYRDVSAISDATDDVYQESPNGALDADLNDYNRLVQNTQRRLKVLSKFQIN